MTPKDPGPRSPANRDGASDAAADSARPSERDADRAVARACAEGDPSAFALLEARYFPMVRAALVRVCAGTAEIDDVLQALRLKLFVAPVGGVPAIATYDGRAKLTTWLCTVAIRLARKSERTRHRSPLVDDLTALDGLVAPSSPELAYFKAQYRDVVRRAVDEAIAGLSTQERHVLRCWATGLTVDEIAAFYGVHRATAARWADASRETLQRGTCAAVRRLTGMTEREYAAVTNVVLSQLVSVVASALAS
jgi:RNA polymerase sigma-70 factor (ECF subfamily)